MNVGLIESQFLATERNHSLHGVQLGLILGSETPMISFKPLKGGEIYDDENDNDDDDDDDDHNCNDQKE